MLILVEPARALPQAQETKTAPFHFGTRFPQEFIQNALTNCGGQRILQLFLKGDAASVQSGRRELLGLESRWLSTVEGQTMARERWEYCNDMALIADDGGRPDVGVLYLGTGLDSGKVFVPRVNSNYYFLLEKLGRPGKIDEMFKSLVQRYRNREQLPGVVGTYYESLLRQNRNREADALLESYLPKLSSAGWEDLQEYLPAFHLRNGRPAVALKLSDELLAKTEVSDSRYLRLLLVKGEALQKTATTREKKMITLLDIREERCPGYFVYGSEEGVSDCLLGLCLGQSADKVAPAIRGRFYRVQARHEAEGELQIFKSVDKNIYFFVHVSNRGKLIDSLQVTGLDTFELKAEFLRLGTPVENATSLFRFPSRVMLLLNEDFCQNYGAGHCAPEKKALFQVGWCGRFSVQVYDGNVVSYMLSS